MTAYVPTRGSRIGQRHADPVLSLRHLPWHPSPLGVASHNPPNDPRTDAGPTRQPTRQRPRQPAAAGMATAAPEKRRRARLPGVPADAPYGASVAVEAGISPTTDQITPGPAPTIRRAPGHRPGGHALASRSHRHRGAHRPAHPRRVFLFLDLTVGHRRAAATRRAAPHRLRRQGRQGRPVPCQGGGHPVTRHLTHLLLPGSRERVRCGLPARRVRFSARGLAGVDCPHCLAGRSDPAPPGIGAQIAAVSTLVGGRRREVMPCECGALMVAGLDHTCDLDDRREHGLALT
jgi:hypothetical protein